MQLPRELCPARLLPAEPTDELLGAAQLRGAQLDLVLEAFLLARHFGELVVQSLVEIAVELMLSFGCD